MIIPESLIHVDIAARAAPDAWQATLRNPPPSPLRHRQPTTDQPD
jgi:hypothetical protein